MFAKITADTLNQMCEKNLSQPLGIAGANASEVSAMLTVAHVVVPANDLKAIVRESDSKVVVLSGLEDSRGTLAADQDKIIADLTDLFSNTRWRKALVVPFTSNNYRITQAFLNRLIRAQIAEHA